MNSKMGKRIYAVISLAVLLLSAYLAYQMLASNAQVFQEISSGTAFLAFVLVVLALHFIKMGRLFLIMLEQKIRPATFVFIYAETAFANLIIPFKLGEAFRFYCLSDVTNNWKIGLLSVVIDRFFDTVALLALLIPIEIMVTASFSMITLLLLAFALLCVVVYAAFPSIYNYLNRFLILSTKSKRSAKALAALEEIHGWYQYAQGLMKGRLAIIIVLSVIAWGIEYCALYLLWKSVGMTLVPENFVTYINSIFYQGELALSTFYFAVSGVILAVVAIVFYVISRIKKENQSRA